MPSIDPPPSRRDNPFATCWTQPGTLRFRFSEGQNAAQLVAKLAAQNWWGQITGAHGSGKTTLLAALLPEIMATGRPVRQIQVREGRTKLTAQELLISPGQLVLVDGFDQLGWLTRRRLKHRCQRAGAGLLVTAHAPKKLPNFVQLSPGQRLIEELVAELCAQVPSRITPADVAASHACHGSNVREIFFDLYDRHEQLRRANRTVIAESA